MFAYTLQLISEWLWSLASWPQFKVIIKKRNWEQRFNFLWVLSPRVFSEWQSKEKGCQNCGDVIRCFNRFAYLCVGTHIFIYL